MSDNVQLAMIDGRDALLMVLVKPSERGDGYITVDAHCDGLDKLQAAKILMHVARSWKAEADAAPHESPDSAQQDRSQQ